MPRSATNSSEIAKTSLPSPKSNLNHLRFSLVGPGRVGSSLAHWITAAGGRPVTVAERRETSRGRQLAQELGARWQPLAQCQTDGQDLLLIAVADDAIHGVAEQLARHPQARVALHCSGSHTGEILNPLATVGCALGSIHPLMAFPHPMPDPAEAARAWFATDGAPEAVALAHDLARAFGGTAVEIDGAQRCLYHLAASIAAGGVATLLTVVDELIQTLDLPQGLLEGYLRLAHGALDRLPKAPFPAAAITGPAARGDAITLERHRQALGATAPDIVPLVDALVAMTHRQIARHG